MNVMVSMTEEVRDELDKQASDAGRTRSAHIKELVLAGRESKPRVGRLKNGL